jgi:hypothetical protein
MHPPFFLCRLLAILVIAGLTMTSLAAPAAAKVMQDVAMHTAMMAGMPDDMPCCPPKPALPDCQKCPVMNLCLPQLLQGMPVAAVIVPMSRTLSRMMIPLRDPSPNGLVLAPLMRPPRTSVLSA